MKIIKLILIAFFIFFFNIYWLKKTVNNKFDKKINQSYYESVQIGEQIWMAENYNEAYFRNGDKIPEAQTDEEWRRARSHEQPAWCYYNNDESLGEKYGKLYNWYAVMDERGLAPGGWHIPDKKEWEKLDNYLNNRAGYKMKSTTDWNNNGNGDNSSGFNGLPGGMRMGYGLFNYLNLKGNWWSTSKKLDYNIYGRSLLYGSNELYNGSFNEPSGMSVRCIKNN